MPPSFLAIITVALSLIELVLIDRRKRHSEMYIYRTSEYVIDLQVVTWLRRWLKSTRRAQIVEMLLGAILAIGTLVALAACGYMVWLEPTWGTLLMSGALLLAWGWTAGVVGKVFDTIG